MQTLTGDNPFFTLAASRKKSTGVLQVPSCCLYDALAMNLAGQRLVDLEAVPTIGMNVSEWDGFRFGG